jgi:hypothetical protein
LKIAYLIYLVFATILMMNVACVSREAISDEYKQSIRESEKLSQSEKLSPSDNLEQSDRLGQSEKLEQVEPVGESLSSSNKKNQTTVVILIDGLSYENLKSELLNRKLPHLARFFQKAGSTKLLMAHSGFPSLTYPNITSLLTASPIDEHGISGNLLLEDGKVLSLESPFNRSKLDDRLRGKTVFAKLTQNHKSSVSFAYMFGEGATTRMSVQDVEVGISIINDGYQTVDSKTIDSVENLLTSTKVEEWPSFIFIHLIGYDLISHDIGPGKKEDFEFLEFLDEKLGSVLSRLENSEKTGRRSIVSLLTADHGFDIPIKRFIPAEKIISRADKKIKFLNEGKLVSLYFPNSWNFEHRRNFVKEFAARSGVELTAISRHEDEIDALHIYSGGKETVLRIADGECSQGNFKIATDPLRDLKENLNYFCPDIFDKQDSQAFASHSFSPGSTPFLTSNLARYFRVPDHADAVIVAAPGFSFTSKYLGNHGGVSASEVIVPLLMRGADLNMPSIPALSDLLKFLAN